MGVFVVLFVWVSLVDWLVEGVIGCEKLVVVRCEVWLYEFRVFCCVDVEILVEVFVVVFYVLCGGGVYFRFGGYMLVGYFFGVKCRVWGFVVGSCSLCGGWRLWWG